MTRLNRRRFLTGAAVGMAAVAAPRGLQQLLNPFGARTAQADNTVPKRLLIVFTPNGVHKEAWFPNIPVGQETLTMQSLTGSLSPLAPLHQRLLVFGADIASATNFHTASGTWWNPDHRAHGLSILNDPSTGHSSVCVLTGRLPTAGGNDNFVPGGPSFDQFIADRIGSTTRFRSLELGVGVNQNPFPGYNRMSFRGAGQQGIRPQDSPSSAFQEVFAGVQPGGSPPDPADPAEPAVDPVAAALARRRRSVLDYARGQMASFRQGLGTVDRQRLDQHETAIRELELSLGGGGGGGGGGSARACSPTNETGIEAGNIRQVLPSQFRIVEQAFSCDLTRVATIMIGGGLSKLSYNWLGDSRDHHTISHEGPVGNLGAIDRWHMEQLAESLTRMANIPEGEGSLLDHTLVLVVNENSNGNAHSHYNVPFLMAGSADGYFRTGRYIQFANGGRPHNDLFVSVANALGLDDVQRFGEGNMCTGPIAELR